MVWRSRGFCVRIVFTQSSPMLLDSDPCPSSPVSLWFIPSPPGDGAFTPLPSLQYNFCHSPWERSIVSHRIEPQDNWCFLVLSLKFLVLSDSRSHLWRIWISSKTVKSRNPFYHCSWNSTYFSLRWVWNAQPPSLDISALDTWHQLSFSLSSHPVPTEF